MGRVCWEPCHKAKPQVLLARGMCKWRWVFFVILPLPDIRRRLWSFWLWSYDMLVYFLYFASKVLTIPFLSLENLFCAGTFQNILSRVAGPALQNADVKLSTKVVRIETNGDKAKIITDKGLEFDYDEVVVTAPLGWLKKNKTAFSPALPPRFSEAIDGIGYGCLEKVRISLLWARNWCISGILKSCRSSSLSLGHSGWMTTRTQQTNLLRDLHNGCLLHIPLIQILNAGIKKVLIYLHFLHLAPTRLSCSTYSANNQLFFLKSWQTCHRRRRKKII